MNKHHDTIELILVWVSVFTSIITPFMPLLQFIAVILAIAVSIKRLIKPRYGKGSNK